MAGGDRSRKGLDQVLAMTLASGATLADAAQRAGVSERTARRRASEPEFAAAVEAFRADLVELRGRTCSEGTFGPCLAGSRTYEGVRPRVSGRSDT